MCENLGLNFLGSIPLDPKIAKSCDEGKFYLDEFPNSPATKAFQNVFNNFMNYFIKK